MNRKLFRGLGREIADRLVTDLGHDPLLETPEPATAVDVLLEQLAANMVGLLREASSLQHRSDPAREARLHKAKRRLARLAFADRDDDDADTATNWSGASNLKYAQPKYKDVESVLKYIESEEGSEVKLVIMNLND